MEVGPHLPAYYTGVTSQGSQCTCVSASLLIGFGPATNLGGLLVPLQRFCRSTNVLRCSGPSQVWAMARATWRVRREEGRSAPGPPWIFFGVSPSIQGAGALRPASTVGSAVPVACVLRGQVRVSVHLAREP